MEVIFEASGLVRAERDLRRGVYVARWWHLCGPHYRAACTAMLDDARRRGGLACYVSDPSEARDIQSREDLLYAATVVRSFIELGCRRFIVVSPHSAVTKLATNRMGRVVDEEGVERAMVATLGEALQLAGVSSAGDSSTMRPQ